MYAIKFIFWSSGFLIFYSYLGYPLVLWLLSFGRGKGIKPAGFMLKVSLLISAYNESSVIGKKIADSLELNYPKNLLEIVVISDGSTDGTREIVERYAEKGVVLRHYEGRIGKTACLNRAVPLAKGEIVIFSDANSRYDRDAVINLVRHFSDLSVGFVTGNTRYTSKSGEVESVGVYALLERVTKSLESRIGSCVGADGAIFAIRKDLFKPLRDFDINDFVIPLNIIMQGYRGVQDGAAFCREDTAGSRNGEFKRQVRITNRTIRAIFNNMALLNPFKFSLFSFELFSHKLCKFLVPFFMMLLLAANVFLVRTNAFYAVTFVMQALFYLTAWVRHMSQDSGRFAGFFSISYIFTVVNLAILMGWIKYLQGETYVVWSPTQR